MHRLPSMHADGKLCGQEGEPGSQREAGLSNPRMVTSGELRAIEE